MTPTPASFTTRAGPFALVAGGTLLLLVDGPDVIVSPTELPIAGGALVTVTFAAKDFGSLAAATAAELAAAINAAAAEAPPGSGPTIKAVVNTGSVMVLATLAEASNGEQGPSIQILSMSTSLAALGLTAGVCYASVPPPAPPGS